jgi:hypothetical protein
MTAQNMLSQDPSSPSPSGAGGDHLALIVGVVVGCVVAIVLLAVGVFLFCYVRNSK